MTPLIPWIFFLAILKTIKSKTDLKIVILEMIKNCSQFCRIPK